MEGTRQEWLERLYNLRHLATNLKGNLQYGID